jgi:hypothetical protein
LNVFIFSIYIVYKNTKYIKKPFPRVEMDTMSDVEDEVMFEHDENEDLTDNEEEVSHDHVTCNKCKARTHIALGECCNCGNRFMISATTGYVLGGEEGDFVVEEGEIEYEGDPDEDEEEEEIEMSDSEEDGDSEEGDDDDDMSNSEEFIHLADPEEDYVPKDFEHEHIEKTPRVTRSMSKLIKT